MTESAKTEIKDLLDRLARMNAAEDWAGTINPTQRAALAYLAKANRFSAKPSQVADYLSATRGTVSQTLKALARKELIAEQRSETDKRSISYSVTKAGFQELENSTSLDPALSRLGKTELTALSNSLKSLVRELLIERENRPFGICKDCHYHQTNKSGAFCALLQEPLQREDISKLCHEFIPAS